MGMVAHVYDSSYSGGERLKRSWFKASPCKKSGHGSMHLPFQLYGKHKLKGSGPD
jgi:hypothetical protein